MFEKVLPGSTKDALAFLGESGILKDAYLAGGTALALQIGHRISVDLDFFTQKKFDAKIVIQRLNDLPAGFRLERADWRTILGFLGETKFAFFYYEYPLIAAPLEFLSVKIADVKDLAPMKLAAISDRGTRRDFIDLYFIVAVEKLVSFREVFELYDKKFKALDANKVHLIKSLTYFEDAETMEVPNMLREVSWNKVKKFFETESKRLAQEILAQ